MTTCTHGLTVSPDRPDAPDECQHCDWCPRCEAVQEYDAEERCTACGRVWGED